MKTIQKNSEIAVIRIESKQSRILGNKFISSGEWLTACLIGKGNTRTIHIWKDFEKKPISLVLSRKEFKEYFNFKYKN